MSRYNSTSKKETNLQSIYRKRRGKVATYETSIYKVVEESNSDIYVIAQEGARLDNLAHEYYNNSRMWWFIAHVNNLNAMNVPAGTRLRIPATLEDAHTIEYKK
jgi:hypothetical protein